MIARKFEPPNLECRVRLAGSAGPAQRRLEQADDPEELRRRLEALGFEVLAIQPYDFQTWKKRADLETAEACRAIEAGEPYKFKDSIWEGLRDYLFRYFDGKCAYCEGKRGGVTPGSVEHYRPKGGVIEAKDHPGYYWLAYNVDNYLPGCTTCNGKKSNHFPLRNEAARVRSRHMAVTGESPLLLNPYVVSEPSVHVSFEIIWEKGPQWKANLVFVQARSEEGAESIKCFDLNREDLRTERAEAVNQVLLAAKEELLQKERRVVADVRDGRREFSAACRQGLKDVQAGGGLDWD